MEKRKLVLVLAAIAFAVVVVAPLARAQLSISGSTLKMSASDVTTSRGAPIAQGGKEYVTVASTSTSGTELFATDLTSSEQITSFAQNIRVTNPNAAGNLCIYDKAWSGASDCSTLCAASAPTCDNTANMTAEMILPGGVYTDTWDGSACLCIRASTGSLVSNAVRVKRTPN